MVLPHVLSPDGLAQYRTFAGSWAAAAWPCSSFTGCITSADEADCSWRPRAEEQCTVRTLAVPVLSLHWKARSTALQPQINGSLGGRCARPSGSLSFVTRLFFQNEGHFHSDSIFIYFTVSHARLLLGHMNPVIPRSVFAARATTSWTAASKLVGEAVVILDTLATAIFASLVGRLPATALQAHMQPQACCQ